MLQVRPGKRDEQHGGPADQPRHPQRDQLHDARHAVRPEPVLDARCAHGAARPHGGHHHPFGLQQQRTSLIPEAVLRRRKCGLGPQC